MKELLLGLVAIRLRVGTTVNYTFHKVLRCQRTIYICAILPGKLIVKWEGERP